jgi:putative NADH-flavin reductase
MVYNFGMKVVVFGANGKVGSIVVTRLLEQNISVTAAIYGHSPLPTDKNLRVASVDVHDSQQVEQAIAGQDAVISTLGSWGTATKDILGVGMSNIIPAMQLHGIQRIISLTGAAARLPDEQLGGIDRINRLVLKGLAKPILLDGENHLSLLVKSSLNWTVVRSPVMNERGNPGAYKLQTNRPPPWSTIHRQSVARVMLELLENNLWNKQSPYINRAHN